MPTDHQPIVSLDVGPHEDKVHRNLWEVKPDVQRVVLEMFRMAEREWEAHPIPNCDVVRGDGLVFAARILQ